MGGLVSPFRRVHRDTRIPLPSRRKHVLFSTKSKQSPFAVEGRGVGPGHQVGKTFCPRFKKSKNLDVAF